MFPQLKKGAGGQAVLKGRFAQAYQEKKKKIKTITKGRHCIWKDLEGVFTGKSTAFEIARTSLWPRLMGRS